VLYRVVRLTVVYCMFVGQRFTLQKTRVLILKNSNGGIGKIKNNGY
jgi:hypothetical protein